MSFRPKTHPTTILSLLILCFVHFGVANATLLSADETPSVEEQARLVLANQLPIEEVIDARVWRAMAGGDIIGNGGGIVEQRMFAAFKDTFRLVSQCLRNLTCPINSVDRNLLERVLQVARQNRHLPESLIFVSSTTYPLFFKDPETGLVRSAKTGFRPELPVFVNREHLYHNGQPALSSAELIGLLVHELGHQAGEANHTRLDDLGARLAAWVLQGGTLIERRLLGQQTQFQVINPKSPDEWPILWMGWNSQTTPLSSLARAQVQCLASDRTPIGMELSNVHWQRESLANDELTVPISAWARIFCQDRNAMVIYEDRDVDFVVTIKRPWTPQPTISTQIKWH